MSLFPDKGSEQRKQEILQRSPFLRTFLNVTYQALNPIQWAADLETHGKKISEDISERLGSNWRVLTIPPLFLHADIFKVFNPMSDEKRVVIIQSMVIAGYEIDNQDDIALMSADVVNNLNGKEYFNPDSLIKPALLSAVGFTSLLLRTGGHLRHTFPEQSTNTEDKPKDPFVDFIKGLDFTGI